jgi:hypothetical protein
MTWCTARTTPRRNPSEARRGLRLHYRLATHAPRSAEQGMWGAAARGLLQQASQGSSDQVGTFAVGAELLEAEAQQQRVGC